MSDEKQSSESNESGDELSGVDKQDQMSELEEALREKDQFHKLAQRAQADLVNYRRRAAEEMDEVRYNTNADILLKIVGIVDDFQRALDMLPQDAVEPGWLDGLNLVMRNIENLLESWGVSKIEALGRPFEPWDLDAVHYEETTGFEPGVVTKVFRDGYMIRDKVLRAAQVVVAREPEPEPEPEETEVESTDEEAS